MELSLTREGKAAAGLVTEVERLLHESLAEILSDREISAVVGALRKLVDGRPAGEAITRRRDGG